jgi:hypothetical protein
MPLEHFIDMYINKIRVKINFSKKGINNRFFIIIKEKRDNNISIVSIHYKAKK